MPQEQKQDVIWEVRACLSTTFCSLDIVRVCVCVGGGGDREWHLLDPGDQSREQAAYVQRGWPPALEQKEGEPTNHTPITQMPQW